MRLLAICFLLLGILFGLTACPYKEVYKPASEEDIVLNGLTVRPVTLFYHSRKDTSSSNVGFVIINISDSVQRLNFQESYLINAKDTLAIEKIYGFGKAFSSDHTFELAPAKDTVLGLQFRDVKSNFQDTLKMGLVIKGFSNHIFLYKRTK